MKNKFFYISLLMCTLVMAICSCCKPDEPDPEPEPEPEPITAEFKITTEYLEAGATSASITGSYEYDYPEKIEGIKVRVGRFVDFSDALAFEADVEGTDFSVEITGLTSGTEYRYRYEVDLGASAPLLTATKTFTTTSESPMVKTLEAQALDSTTFDINCEVVSDGGQEVTERGICWNTYGDPTLDDETLQHASGGLGQYTIHMVDLPSNTVHYVRAYAKNATGIGFGEELVFRTGGVATKPQVSTVEVNEVTYNSAQCVGNVSSDGGLDITERGVCWGREPEPTLNGYHTVAESTGLGVFTVTLGGLLPSTTYHVRCYAVNEKGIAYGEELTLTTLEGLPIVTTGAVTEVTATSARCGGEVTEGGASPVTDRGLCWNTTGNPTLADYHLSGGSGTGIFTVIMNTLSPNETYYVKAYATNSQGTTYGAEVSFTAMEGLPVVQTYGVTNITATSAKGHGKVIDQGGSSVIERGVCWSTEPSPTISGSHAHSGTGLGEYEVSMNSLSPGTKYYVRAYARNTQGLTYGEEKSFTTQATLPTVTLNGITGITARVTVSFDGGASVTERGVCWGTSYNPTTNDSHISSGTGTGSFEVELTNLAPGTTYYVRAYATNSVGTAYSNQHGLTTQANPATVMTGEVSNITQTTALGSGNVTNDGGAQVTARGLCWSTSHNPTTSGSHASSGTGTGSFTVNMTGLTPNTTYYVRAYATNSSGTSYGIERSFTTTQSISAPTVTTGEVSNITQTTALGSGNVTNSGGASVTARGLCWSTNHNPTTSGSHASSGTGTGSFTVNMTGLTPNTTYYVRAYATNSAGTSYGSEVSFTTADDISAPTVTTGQVTEITQTTATGSGDVTNDGGASVTTRGVCWSTSHNPTTNDSHVSGGSGTGSFTVNITGLTANTTYYVRAYAVNSVGTSYGSEVSFTTLAPGSTIPAGAIDGLFTINASGDQVYFAQGNLQYKATTGVWRFAPNQYDYIGDDNENIDETYNGWIDLIGWGTSGYDHGGLSYQPWDTCTDAANYYAYGFDTYNLFDETGQADWGYNAISNGGNTTQQWRTLTGGNSGEWYYVFNSRSTASGIRYAKAKVNNVNGVILLPDNWSASTYSLNNTNQTSASYNSNVISATQWNTLQAAGAVFLPAGGYRSKIWVENAGSYGLYWSASYCDESRAYGVYFEDGVLRPSRGGSRDIGRNVRLVIPAE